MLQNNTFLRKHLLLLLFIPLFLIKSWIFFNEPRIWAEEGTVYFANAVKYGISSVLKVQQGYFSIIPNITLYIASLFNYKYVPLFTFFVSFGFWMLPLWLINNINSDELEYDYLTKFLMGASFFVLLNYYQEIFLNTINLQFLTPLILFIILLYDFKKLSLIKKLFFYFIILICLTNGILAFSLVPLLIYKMVAEKKPWLALFFLAAFIIPIIAVFSNSEPTDLSISQRLLNNFNYKVGVIKAHNYIDLVVYNYYWLLLIVALYFLRVKNYLLSYFLAAIFILFLFIDYTKILLIHNENNISGRYKVLLFGLMIITFFLFVKKNILNYITTTTLIIVFGKQFFRHEYSHDENVKKWSQEYKNLYQHKPAEIYPEGWKIDLK